VKLEDKFVTDMTIEVSDDGDIIAGGFYSNKGVSSVDGTYFLTVDGKSKQIRSTVLKEFDLDFITEAMTEKKTRQAEQKEMKGKDQELYEYDLDELIVRDDGGVVLIGEQFYVETFTHTFTDANGVSHTTHTTAHHYNDIIVVKLSQEGMIEWARKLPKRQTSELFSSYVSATTGDKLYFVFNDDPRNLIENDEAKPKKFKPGKESTVVLVEIDDEGEMEKKSLFGSEDAHVVCVPKLSKQTDLTELVIFGQKGNKHRLFKVEFAQP